MSTTHDPQDRQDEDLRALLASIDPELGDPGDAAGRTAAATAPVALLERVLAEYPEEQPDEEHDTGLSAPPDARRRGFWQRHWQGSLLVAAGVTSLALAGASVLGPLGLGSGADSTAQSGTSAGAAQEPAPPEAAPAPDGAVRDSASGAQGSYEPELGGEVTTGPGKTGTSDTDTTDKQTLVRSGTVLVGTDDQKAGRDSFVTTVTGMGGRVLSEAVVTEGGETAVQPADGRDMMMGVTYPYPWWPSTPGIWLTVQVPAERYDEALAAARATGEVVSMQQSSYDVGTQVADIDARVAALEDSLKQLRSLMGETSSVSEVIQLEAAIAERQSELDGLKAQQRELANQTAMSQISLTLMSPEDATATVDPQPSQTWWESFLAGLSDAWAWLGKALMILSPLLIALAIILVVRRRRSRAPHTTPPNSPTAEE